MLDNTTKRLIDSARNTLVGKVPDPKGQIEHITIALIYKFMDDMDREAVEKFGGKTKYFTGEFEKYSWRNLFNARLGGHDMLALYREAVERMYLNPNIPDLFKSIFKNAYLAFNAPDTLKMFLKIINEFNYDHSENLGNAYEYLLSVLGTQGDAGQFRTPRHIIEFIVACVDPQKHESILDPACGTAGFILSSYKHILRNNAKIDDGDKLTPDERKHIAENLVGFDIDPNMVRFSLVNMFLHKFQTPHIYEYDTLSSEDRWNEYYDVIVANPPFMTPKGGIKPHKRFSIQATKSEVLFTDYMAEHLNPNGRAGIIVPNGIIATTQTAYVSLRKILVENYLVAVVSLPAGVFNPYSGVKTSVLLLDKVLSKKTNSILFLKIDNDGYDLGAQRRDIDKNDLPEALKIFNEYKTSILTNTDFIPNESSSTLLVKKKKILENKDVNLSGDRYAEGKQVLTEFNVVQIGDLFKTSSGGTPLRNKIEYYENGTIPWLKSGEVAQGYIYKAEEYITVEGLKNSSAKLFPINSVLVAMYGATAGQVGILKIESTTNQAVCAIYPDERIIPEYLYCILKQQTQKFVELSGGGGQPNISQQIIREFQIPLPPLEIQQQIVAEIEGYQKIIDGARMVVENYKPTIKIKPEWEMVELGDICKPEYGFTETAKEIGEARFIRITDIDENGKLKNSEAKYIDLTENAKRNLLKKDDILVARTGATYGKTMVFNEDYTAVFASFLMRLNFDTLRIYPRYYWVFAQSDNYIQQKERLVTGGGQPQFNGNAIIKIIIPLPPFEEQPAIVAQIEDEQKMVEASKKLIELFEQKIKDRIAEVWGEKE